MAGWIFFIIHIYSIMKNIRLGNKHFGINNIVGSCIIFNTLLRLFEPNSELVFQITRILIISLEYLLRVK